MILIEALLNAPLVAISKRWPGVLHAADMDTITDAWPSGTVTAVCGATRLRLLAGKDGDAGLWPPVAKSPNGWTRCRDCWLATGKKRPRSRWVLTQYDGDAAG